MTRFLMKIFLAGGALALVLQALRRTGSTQATTEGSPYAAIDTYVEQQMRRLNIPGATLAIVENDSIVHQRGFGQARPNDTAPTPQTPFLIGSLTKSFTALAVMQLVETQQIDLDAHVQRYLPWFNDVTAPSSTPITVRHLLNQTSGLSTVSGWIPLANFDSSPNATERQAQAATKLKRAHPVGTTFEYSNTNYNLLGLIIEAVSGQTYANYIQTHVFTPLEMHHSYTNLTEARKNGLAVGHRYWFWVPVATPNLPQPQGSLPSGQLIASAEDMAHYVQALLNEGRYNKTRILSSESVIELHRGVAEHDEMGMSMGRYGMGWFDRELGGTRVIWHSGMVPEFSSYMALLPTQKRGLVLLLNADHFMMNPILTEVGAGLAALLAGNQPPPMRLGFLPWLMRSLLFIPLLQLIDLATTGYLLHRQQQSALNCPGRGNWWGLHILLPLTFHVLIGLTLLPMLGAMRGFWRLFAPDFAWIATVCGSFAGLWAFLRTSLILRTLCKS